MDNWKKGDINVNIDYAHWVRNSDEVVNCGTSNDNIIIASVYDTVYAGAGHDKITFWTDSNNGVVYGEAGNDFIRNEIVGGNSSTIYGGKGNDTIRLESRGDSDFAIVNIYADGGDDNDLFIPLNHLEDTTLVGGNGDDTVWFIESSALTISGGAGKDTYRFDPYYLSGPYHNDIVITDISSEDVIRNDYSKSDGSELTYYKAGNGNIVLKDEDYGLFTATLQGITEISQIASLPYISSRKKTTLGELFSSSPEPEPPNPGPGTNDSVNNSYIVYSGGNKTVSYSENQQVNLATDFTGVEVDGDNFIVKSSSGQLTLQNVRGKYVKYGDANSNLVAYSYMGTNGSGSSSYSSVGNSYSSYNTIDARSKGAVYDVLIGGNNSNDVIYASSGGSSLWGGSGGADTLVGGRGDDEFVYKYGDGNDVIQNAGSNDLVDLSIIKLSQITRAEVNISGVTIRFTDGGTLRVEGNASGMSYKVAEGTFRCNQYNGQWTTR